MKWISILTFLIFLPFNSRAEESIMSDDSIRPTVASFPAEDFTAEVVNRTDGSTELLVTALTDNREIPLSGSYRFLINITGVQKDTIDLQFYNGKATTSFKKEGLYFIKPLEPDNDLIHPHHGRLYHFSAQKDGYGKYPIPLWLSIIPPLIAIVLAIALREGFFSLFAGIFSGGIILYAFTPEKIFIALYRTIDTYIIASISNPDHVAVIVFSLLIGGMVALISRNGGMAGVVQRLSKYANSARNSQIITYLLGIAIFFDDYANTLIVGSTMRPVTDRHRVSREKLAYLVDSTAAPVAAIAFVTTWIGTELGYIANQTETLGIAESAYSIFINSLQFAFYPILTLVFMAILIWERKDYGSMLTAERRARQFGEVFDSRLVNQGLSEIDDSQKELAPVPGIRYRWYNAVVPIATMLVVTILGLLITGWSWKEGNGFFTNIMETIGNANSYKALLWGSLSGVMTAIFLSLISHTMNFRFAMETMIDGFKTMLPALVILVLAWSLAIVTEELHTADYLTGLFSGAVSPHWMPLITFLLAGGIAFSTGSSWSTMAILYPILLPTSWSLSLAAGWDNGESMYLLYNVTSVILAGAVFGDHCSPISDTTVLSSLASNCNHIDHVRTQLPYAITVGLVSIFAGTFLVFLGLPWWINFPIAIFILWLIIRIFGKLSDLPGSGNT